jgi:hypothetical protein
VLQKSSFHRSLVVKPNNEIRTPRFFIHFNAFVTIGRCHHFSPLASIVLLRSNVRSYLKTSIFFRKPTPRKKCAMRTSRAAAAAAAAAASCRIYSCYARGKLRMDQAFCWCSFQFIFLTQITQCDPKSTGHSLWHRLLASLDPRQSQYSIERRSPLRDVLLAICIFDARFFQYL